MLALWLLRDEAGLRRAAGQLVIAGAVGALALAGLAGEATSGSWWHWPAAHWPLLLAAAAWLLLVVPAGGVRGPGAGGIGWRVIGLGAIGLAAAAWLALGRWPEGMPGSLTGRLALGALGAVVGLALVPGLLPRFVALRPPGLWWAARGAPPDPSDPLVERALALWPRIERADPAPEVRRALASALARQLVAARRCRQLAAADTVPAAAALAAEQEVLAARQRDSQDLVARVRYADARRSLDVQAQHLATIATTRERMRAQLHRQLEAMEALHLASVTARAADADRRQGDETWRPLLAELARMGDELDAAREVDNSLRDPERVPHPPR
jgi:hypothetical protein